MEFAAAAAVLTAGYALVLPTVSLHSVTIATGAAFIALCVASGISETPFCVKDLRLAGLLLTTFASYQWFLYRALKENVLYQSIVNLNVVLLTAYRIAKTQVYTDACELFAAGVLMSLLSAFISNVSHPDAK